MDMTSINTRRIGNRISTLCFSMRRMLAIVAIVAAVSLAAKEDFTPLEQQQISIATPGLFGKSSAFTVDFAALRQSDYSFPLPVGKARVAKDNSIEITTTKGDAVKAMFDGTVRLSRHHNNMGNVIVVRHDNGLETVYWRNAQNLVNVGDRVKAGQTIAIVGGENGRTFCLVAIMVNGGRINPEMILNVGSHKLLRQTILCKKSGANVDMSVIREDKQNKAMAASDKPFANGNKHTINFANFNPREWCYPLPESKVISAYGSRGGRRHTGVDIKTKPNDDIHAAFDGVVTMSQKYSAYGNCIKIKHDNGLETIYSHNSKNLVKVGDKVKAGQVIALTGRTGRATTEHLHFECRINGQPFDPALVFDHLNHSLQMKELTFTKSGSSIKIHSNNNYMAKGR